MSLTTYTVKPGDRWDTIAYKAYGVASRFPEITKANPFTPSRDEPIPGTVLLIPVDESTTEVVTPPVPWK